MLTRCTACATTFRVTPEQLKARLGRVRCGQCQTVFNALDSLVEEQSSVVPPVENIKPEVSPLASPAPAVPPSISEAAPTADSAPSTTPQSSAVQDLPTLEVEPQSTEPQTGASEYPLTNADHAPNPVNEAPGVSIPIPNDIEVTPKAPKWPWILGLFLSLALLTVQLLLQFRVELSVFSPDIKPALLILCEPLGCDIPLPAHADLLNIETSDLHPGDGKGRLQLAATLRNRASYAQIYPMLELTLNDVADHPLVVRSFRPEEYLPRTLPAREGFAPRSDLALTLDIDVSDLPAAGYRLYIYYP